MLYRFWGKLFFTFILLVYRLIISSDNKIKIEQWLFRFYYIARRAVDRRDKSVSGFSNGEYVAL